MPQTTTSNVRDGDKPLLTIVPKRIKPPSPYIGVIRRIATTAVTLAVATVIAENIDARDAHNQSTNPQASVKNMPLPDSRYSSLSYQDTTPVSKIEGQLASIRSKKGESFYQVMEDLGYSVGPTIPVKPVFARAGKEGLWVRAVPCADDTRIPIAFNLKMILDSIKSGDALTWDNETDVTRPEQDFVDRFVRVGTKTGKTGYVRIGRFNTKTGSWDSFIYYEDHQPPQNIELINNKLQK